MHGAWDPEPAASPIDNFSWIGRGSINTRTAPSTQYQVPRAYTYTYTYNNKRA